MYDEGRLECRPIFFGGVPIFVHLLEDGLDSGHTKTTSDSEWPTSGYNR